MSGREERVLLLAPTGRDASLSCAMLQAEGMCAEACPTIEALCASAADGAGVLLIAEEALPSSAVKRLVETLEQQPPWSDIPVIVLAGGEFGTSSVRPLNVLGPLRNVMILERPVRRLILIRTVAVTLRARRRQFEVRAYLDERAKLLESERSARAEAEEASRLKDEFLMTVSHELRTPLTAIYGWARMLVSGAIRDDQRQRAIETIERNAQAQTQLVNDLLDVSRAISGKVRLDLAPVDLPYVIRAAMDSIQPAADAKNIRLQTVLDPQAGPIVGDQERLQQVVWNLLSNAVKFTPDGGRVQVRLERRAAHVEIIVTDTGRGITREFLPYVFDRFRQAEGGTTRQHGGLGLGLAIVRHLVELHGGRVAAESGGAEEGTTFRVVLPLTISAPYPAQDAAPAVNARSNVSHRKKLERVRVLIVDDEPQARELFGVVVENAGAVARFAASAAEALRLLEDWRPDVLLSDIEMPHEDGYALMKQVRTRDTDAHSALVAIAVTAHSRPEDRVRALEAGFQWHLPKPVDPDELVGVVASLTRPLAELAERD